MPVAGAWQTTVLVTAVNIVGGRLYSGCSSQEDAVDTMISELFEAIDRKDVQRFAGFLTDDCALRFGNLPAVSGCGAIEAFVAGFFASIRAVAHDITDCWEIPQGMVCHGQVTYIRLDGSALTVPFCNVFRMRQSRVAEYLIFVDASALSAPAGNP